MFIVSHGQWCSAVQTTFTDAVKAAKKEFATTPSAGYRICQIVATVKPKVTDDWSFSDPGFEQLYTLLKEG